MRLFRHQYYLLKPYLPWRLRMAVRRWFARRKLARCRDIWPIKPGTETPPKDWPGWPDGKQFARPRSGFEVQSSAMSSKS